MPKTQRFESKPATMTTYSDHILTTMKEQKQALDTAGITKAVNKRLQKLHPTRSRSGYLLKERQCRKLVKILTDRGQLKHVNTSESTNPEYSITQQGIKSLNEYSTL